MVEFVCVLLWLWKLRTDANATTGGEGSGEKQQSGMRPPCYVMIAGTGQ